MLVVLVLISISSLVVSDDVINVPSQQDAVWAFVNINKYRDSVQKLQSELDKVRREKDECKRNETVLSKALADGFAWQMQVTNELETLKENCRLVPRVKRQSTINNQNNNNFDRREKECNDLLKDEKDRCEDQLSAIMNSKTDSDMFARGLAIKKAELQNCETKFTDAKERYREKVKDLHVKLNNFNTAVVSAINDVEEIKNETKRAIGLLQHELEECKSNPNCTRVEFKLQQCQVGFRETKEKLEETTKNRTLEMSKLITCEDRLQTCKENEKSLNAQLTTCTLSLAGANDDLMKESTKNDLRVSTLEVTLEDCKSGRETCEKTGAKCDLTLNEITNQSWQCTRNLNTETEKLQTCENEKKTYVQKCESQEEALNLKLQNCNTSLVNLETSLNEKDIEYRMLNISYEKLKNASFSLTPRFGEHGCQVFENISPPTEAHSHEMSFIIGRHQYIADYGTKTTWEEARDNCKSRGMALIQLESPEEFDNVIPKLQRDQLFLKNRFTGYTAVKLTRIWLGAMRVGVDGNSSYHWDCGSTPVEVFNYATTKPANYTSSMQSPKLPCLSLKFDSPRLGGSYISNPCHYKFNRVCEKLIR